MSVCGGFVQPGGIDPNISCGFLDSLGADWFSAIARREQIYLCCGGHGVQREGTEAFSPREGAAPLLFLYGHTPVRGNKQIWPFTATHSAQTTVCSRWGSLAVADNVGDVAFSCSEGSRNADFRVPRVPGTPR